MIPQTTQDKYITLVVPVTNFNAVPDTVSYYNLFPLNFTTFQVQSIFKDIVTQCFNLAEVLSIAGQLTVGSPWSLHYLVNRCHAQNPAKYTIDKFVKTTEKMIPIYAQKSKKLYIM